MGTGSSQIQKVNVQKNTNDEAAKKQELFDLHCYLEDPEDLEAYGKKKPLITPEVGYRVELGGAIKDVPDIKLEEVEKHSLYYKEKFCSQEHFNYVGGNAASPLVISLASKEKIKKNFQWKALVRTKKDDLHYDILAPNRNSALKQLKLVAPDLAEVQNLMEVKEKGLVNELLHMEDRILIKAYKIGVVYCKEGQTDETDMFSNENGSKEFNDFMDFLGDKVKLKGYKAYRGGLDVEHNTTGTHTYVTNHYGFDIVFHVSTLLPYSTENRQQLERKRHIGNDVVVIVFQDGPAAFKPTTITSKFNHVYMVVQVDNPSKKPNEKGGDVSDVGEAGKESARDRSNSNSKKSGGNDTPTKRPSTTSAKKTSKRKNSVADGDDEQLAKERVQSTPTSSAKKKGKSKTKYRIAVVSKHGVKPHGPVIPRDKVWEQTPEFREFIMTKLVNAERAAYAAPGFAQSRTRRLWLKDLLEKYHPNPTGQKETK